LPPRVIICWNAASCWGVIWAAKSVGAVAVADWLYAWHRSVQPSSSGSKGPSFAKSVSGNLGELRTRKGGPPGSAPMNAQQASAMAIKLRHIDQEELACEIDEAVRRAIHYASM
jgi:hypothetical protein